MMTIIAFAVILAISLVGVLLKDWRYLAGTLAISLVMLILVVAHEVPR